MLTSDPNDTWSIVDTRLDVLEKRALIMIYIGGLTQAQVAQRLCKQRIEVEVAVARALRVVAHAVEIPADTEQFVLPQAASQ